MVKINLHVNPPQLFTPIITHQSGLFPELTSELVSQPVALTYTLNRPYLLVEGPDPRSCLDAIQVDIRDPRFSEVDLTKMLSMNSCMNEISHFNY